MSTESDNKLDRLLREVFPTVEVSPDFTLNLWRRLMKQPSRPPWMMPAPVYAMAAAIGIFAGVQTWVHLLQPQGSFERVAVLSQMERLDLFGNAPFDSLAGSYLHLTQERTA